MNRHNIKKILAESALAPSKKLGQNFLVCPQTVEQLLNLAKLNTQDKVVELGVGLASLTKPLATRVQQVIGLEIDRGIIKYHQENHDLPLNVTIRHQDLLQQDFRKLAEELACPLKIMANLPYSISNPLLFKLLEVREEMDWAILMLQKEVGGRLTASPGSKEYGILSVLYNGCSKITPLLKVDPSKFHPQPKVDSVVVKIDFYPPPYPDRVLPDPTQLMNLVKAGFQQRRKTLVNALAGSKLALDKKNVSAALEKCDLSPRIRAEALSYQDFLHLALQLEL